MLRLAVLGATGSIGRQTLKVAEMHPDLYKIEIVVNNSNAVELAEIRKRFNPVFSVCVEKNEIYKHNEKKSLSVEIVNKAEFYSDVDIVVNGIVGTAGLLPSLAALEAGKILATANKESLVAAGSFFEKYDKNLIRPIDSEHSTVWQLLNGNDCSEIILTASGGAFRDLSKGELSKATAVEALWHPNWVMGKKVTVDCATLMNKGMEIIEAKRLFRTKNISVVLHRESIIHAMVRFCDNTVIAGMSAPDMVIPIQYALSYPKRLNSGVKQLDFFSLRSLSFGRIDEDRFPCFQLAKRAFEMGDIAGCVMNAANDVMVSCYMRGETTFYRISDGIASAMDKFAEKGEFSDVRDVFGMDRAVREYTLRYGGHL